MKAAPKSEVGITLPWRGCQETLNAGYNPGAGTQRRWSNGLLCPVRFYYARVRGLALRSQQRVGLLPARLALHLALLR